MFTNFMKTFAVWLILIFAKILSFSSRIFRRGSGTALPGLFVEQRAKWVVGELAKYYKEVIFISGTNGKTTTRALLVHIYEQNGVGVCTNRGGANIYRGIVSAILSNTKLNLKPIHATAILEVEEATLPILTEYLKPTKLILTNIFRDQLDAYGEIDKTVDFFRQTLAKSNPVVYINAEDNKLLACLDNFDGTVIGFELDTVEKPKYEPAPQKVVNFNQTFQATSLSTNGECQYFEVTKIPPNPLNRGEETLQTLLKESLKLTTNLSGMYNIYNVLAASIVGYESFGDKIVSSIAEFQPVFGRGEKVVLGGAELKLFLIKNPAGFEQVLQDIERTNKGKPIKIVVLINDNIADGKDVSWLWDVDLESFIRSQKMSLIKTGGVRGLDMLLRLEYAGAGVKAEDCIGEVKDLVSFLKKQEGEIYVLSTYTATLALRQELSKHTLINDIAKKGN